MKNKKDNYRNNINKIIVLIKNITQVDSSASP